MKSLGIEKRGATNTVFWVVIGLAVFFWIINPLGTKAIGMFSGKVTPKKDAGTTTPTTATPKA